MLETILNILKKKELAGWIVTEENLASTELFFVKNKLDQNRLCETTETTVEVFVDFEEAGEDGVERYKGKGEALLSAGDSAEEIEARIDNAIVSACFVKNKWYPMATNDVRAKAPSSTSTPSDTGTTASTSSMASDTVSSMSSDTASPSNTETLKTQYDALYEALFADYGMSSQVNSVELFAVDGTRHVLTSTGTEVTYPVHRFVFELVTDAKGATESVEIFNDYTFGLLDVEQMRDVVKTQLADTEARAAAVKAPKLENINVILRGSAVEDLLSLYVVQASDEAVYSGFSRAKIGERFTGENALQPLNIRMDPSLSHAVDKAPIDKDGVLLHPYDLYRDSVVQNFRTSQQFSSYMDRENIGSPIPFVVEGSDTPYEDFLDEDYLEIYVFSSFVSSPIEGDFGGEYRLAKLVQNGKTTFITGGSLSENLFEAQDRMVFSKECEKRENSLAPKAILIRKK